MRSSIRKQQGISLFGLIFLGAIIAFIGIVAAQVIPPLNEYLTIKKQVTLAKNKANTVEGIRREFDATAYVNDISSVTGKDLDITKVDDKIKVSFAYQKEIPLGGPVFLLIKFSGSSD